MSRYNPQQGNILRSEDPSLNSGWRCYEGTEAAGLGWAVRPLGREMKAGHCREKPATNLWGHLQSTMALVCEGLEYLEGVQWWAPPFELKLKPHFPSPASKPQAQPAKIWLLPGVAPYTPTRTPMSSGPQEPRAPGAPWCDILRDPGRQQNLCPTEVASQIKYQKPHQCQGPDGHSEDSSRPTTVSRTTMNTTEGKECVLQTFRKAYKWHRAASI